jgi:hypothetical protein
VITVADAKSRSILKASQRAERELVLDKHRDLKAQVSHSAKVARQREKDEHRAKMNAPVRMAGDHSNLRLKGEDQHIRETVAKHADLDSQLKSELKKMHARHGKRRQITRPESRFLHIIGCRRRARS